MTDEVQFEPPHNVTVVNALSPDRFAHFPLSGDPSCPDSRNQLQFRISLLDRDVEEPLYGYWSVNGEPARSPSRGGISESPATSPLSVERVGTICIAKDSFGLPCNLVEVLVSDRPTLGQNIDPSFPKAHWFILAPSDEQPEVSPSDCAALFDGGAPDAGADADVDGGIEGGMP